MTVATATPVTGTVTTTLGSGPSTVEYLVSGTGPGVLLVHGTGADALTNWAPLTEAIADRFTVVAVNLSGAGATTDSGAPLTVDDLAGQAIAAAGAAGLTDYHIVGHSLGAVVGTAVAARRPEAARSLVTHGGWVTTDPRSAFQFDLWGRLLRTDKDLLARLLQLTVFSQEALASLDTDGLRAAAEGFTAMLDERIDRQVDLDARVDISALLPAVQAPTLVIASTDDQIVPIAHQRALAAGITGAEYVEVRGGHALPFENPVLFADTIAGFLDRQQHTHRA
ncbi:alpha/beta fold hydrolase [Kitasatospora sp. NPDC057223]|uniref:alpha/beta fold hydrolase n=1 Tax=Kitasatospora sp. NPDC057223 TaxID=3346055 RepID=UPI003631803D